MDHSWEGPGPDEVDDPDGTWEGGWANAGSTETSEPSTSSDEEDALVEEEPDAAELQRSERLASKFGEFDDTPEEIEEPASAAS